MSYEDNNIATDKHYVLWAKCSKCGEIESGIAMLFNTRKKAENYLKGNIIDLDFEKWLFRCIKCNVNHKGDGDLNVNPDFIVRKLTKKKAKNINIYMLTQEREDAEIALKRLNDPNEKFVKFDTEEK